MMNVSFRYPAESLDAITDFTLEVGNGESVAILGHSGSGKSTIVHLISGLLTPTRGEIRLGDRLLADVAPADRRVALVLQRPPVLRGMTVEQLVERPAARARPNGRSLTVACACEALGLTELRGKQVHELSGGEQQRVHLARALVWEPDFIVLDEPFSSLDYKYRRTIYPLLRSHHQQLGKSLILITHDPQEALLLCDRLVVIKNGRELLSGSSKETARCPRILDAAQILLGYATNEIPVSLAWSPDLGCKLTTPFGQMSGHFEPSGSGSRPCVGGLALLHWKEVVPDEMPAESHGRRKAELIKAGDSDDVESPSIYCLGEQTLYGASPSGNRREVYLTIGAREVLIYSSDHRELLGTFRKRAG